MSILKTDVSVWNTNTNRAVVETVEVNPDGSYREDGEYHIPGVNSTGSEVKIAFIDPAGSMTGKLFPSGQRQQVLRVTPPASLAHIEPFGARVTLIDSANPFIFVDAASIAMQLQQAATPESQNAIVEAIRQEGAVAMGTAATTEIAAKTRGTPKIALVYPPSAQVKPVPDIRILAYSMGLPHPTLQLSGAVCVASGLSCAGTVLSDIASQPIQVEGAPITPERTPSPEHLDAAKVDYVDGASTEAQKQTTRQVVIEHSRGTIEASVVVGLGENGEEKIESCAVSRTARRLFEGNVRYFV
jgi:2-methylaconitate cis-trans-isomerase PrpF